MVKVSVIIPVYNVEKYLRRCLDSVVNQTLKNIEIICINDGSTDGSLAILKEYAQKDARIKLIDLEVSSGPAIARNKGLEIAQGEYLGFVDSDDFISNNYYDSLYQNAFKYDADISMTSNICLYAKKLIGKKYCSVQKKTNIVVSNFEKSEIIIASGICWNKIYKRTFLLKNNLRHIGSFPGADNIFTATSIIKSKKIVVTNRAKYFYVQLDDSIVHKLKTRESFNIINNYKYIDNWIDQQKDLDLSEKFYWKCVNNVRKSFDFGNFINTMSPDCIEEFKMLASRTLKLSGLIISLTSYPLRINTVHKTIESLLNQSMKAEKIILWLAEEEFPNKEGDLPKELLELERNNTNFQIDWCENIKSYKKLIPTLRKYPNKIIVTADDDIIYAKNCIETLVNTYIKYPNCIIANRAHYITFKNKKIKRYNDWIMESNYQPPSFNLFLTGVGGVLYFPGCFYKEVLNEKLFLELCKDTDDIWFWAMSVLNGTKIKLAEGNCKDLHYIDNTQDVGLWQNINNSGNNDVNINHIIKAYPQILDKLNKKHVITQNILKTIIQTIFSIKNVEQRKVITILGLKIKYRKIKNRKQDAIKKSKLIKEEI